MTVHVVLGPPGAGKTTWVRKHAKPDDIVIDCDAIAVALTVREGEHHDHPEPVLTTARVARKAAIDMALKLADHTDIYLIHAAPPTSVMWRYAHIEHEVHTLDPGYDEVMTRCHRLGRSESAIGAVERWYETP